MSKLLHSVVKMRSCALSTFGLIIAIILLTTGRNASAIPAYANRTGLQCSNCHLPIYPRLTRFGWEFRRMGYRTPDEMNQTLRFGQRAGDDKDGKTPAFSFADTLSVDARLRFDDIARQKAKRFDQGYLAGSDLYFSGPADKNFGYNLIYTLGSQSPAFNKAAGRYDVGELSSDLFEAIARYYNGKPGRYFSAKIGQVGPLDGYGGSDRAISLTNSLLFGNVNQISANKTQRDLDLGYTYGPNHLSVIALEGVPSTGDGTESRPGNHLDWELQYLRFLDRAGSSVQAIYHIGQTPLNDSGSLVDNFSQFYLLGNWRLPMRKSRALDVLGGYGIDSHDKLVSAAAPAMSSTHGRFNAESYFVEVDYELSQKLSPYFRYDAIHSNESNFGATAPGNPLAHNNQWTLGIAQQPARNLRISLEYAASRPKGGPNVDQIRGQLWFIF